MKRERGTSRRQGGSVSVSRRWGANVIAPVLAAAMVIIVAAPAHAGSPVYFINPSAGEPGHFDWAAGPLGSSVWLDVTQPPQSQDPDTPGTQKVRQVRRTDGVSSYLRGGAPDFNLVVRPVDSTNYILRQVEWEPFVGFVPDGSETWNRWGFIAMADYTSLLPEGAEAYLGLRFDPGMGDGLHYGCIGVVRRGAALDAFMWGFDLDPAIPEPSSLSMLASGAGAAMARRRRKGGVRTEAN